MKVKAKDRAEDYEWRLRQGRARKDIQSQKNVFILCRLESLYLIEESFHIPSSAREEVETEKTIAVKSKADENFRNI